jgi:hypothetical protein
MLAVSPSTSSCVLEPPSGTAPSIGKLEVLVPVSVQRVAKTAQNIPIAAMVKRIASPQYEM